MRYTPFRAVALVASACLTAGIANLCICSGQSSSPRSLSSIQQNSSNGSQKSSAASQSSSPDAASASGQNPAAQGEIDRHLSRGESLARTALAYRGAPYRFGSRSGGFDCSGLMQTVCAKYGIYLPRAANAQFNVGLHIPKDQLQTGDLVFFQNTYKRGISHVGIYIGEGQFLHAAGRRKGVVVSRLEDAYHTKHYAGARRMDLSKLPHVPGEEKVVLTPVLDETLAGEGGSAKPSR